MIDVYLMQRNLNIRNTIYKRVMNNYTEDTFDMMFDLTAIDDQVEIITDINDPVVSITIEINKSDGTRYNKRIQNHQ